MIYLPQHILDGFISIGGKVCSDIKKDSKQVARDFLISWKIKI